MTLVLTAWSALGGVMAADERLTCTDPGDARARAPMEGHRKVIPWPAMRAAVGFAGLAHAWTGRSMDDELERFMLSREWGCLEEFARALPGHLASLMPAREYALKVSVTGFGPNPQPETDPEFWHVRNTEWDKIPDHRHFRVDEDLRTTAIATTPMIIRDHLWFARWIGEHHAYARRAHDAMNLEGSRSLTIDGLGTWARAEIRRARREIAAMLLAARAAKRLSGVAPRAWTPEIPMSVGPRARAVLITREDVTEQRDAAVVEL